MLFLFPEISPDELLLAEMRFDKEQPIMATLTKMDVVPLIEGLGGDRTVANYVADATTAEGMARAMTSKHGALPDDSRSATRELVSRIAAAERLLYRSMTAKSAAAQASDFQLAGFREFEKDIQGRCGLPPAHPHP